ncbi:MAG: hypothetical protein RMJ98_05565 [Myxococcales bacterium]|nr:hypothetical protein [Polyangiaceae bacterium]MDW8248759.1 hypothetical protein [Myxococcales bacterium]
MTPPAARWGALLAATLTTAFAPGCSQPPPPAAPPPPTPPVPEPPPPPPPAPSHLSEISFVLDKPQEEAVGRQWRIHQRTTRYGKGALVIRTYERGSSDPPRCPLRLPGPCQTLTFRITNPPPDEATWLRRGTLGDSEAGTERGPFPAQQAWMDFSGGREAVFALRRDGRSIDRIDEEGRAILFAKDPGVIKSRRIQIYEIGTHTILIRQRDNGYEDTSWEIAELSPPEDKAPRKPGPWAKLPMAPVHEARLNAQGARTAVEQNGMAMFGSPVVMRLDEQGSWAMAWLEVVPPPYRWPAGKPQAPSKAPSKKGAKNGCGGPPSRGLDDRSVTKRAHVTRFSGAILQEDTVQWSTSNLDVYSYELKARMEAGKVVIEEPSKTDRTHQRRQGSVHGFLDDYEDLEISPSENVRHAEFDPEAKEGLVLVDTGEKLFARAFDDEGKWLGPAFPYRGKQPYHIRSFTKLGTRWFALGDEEAPILDLSGSNTLRPELPEDESLVYLYQKEGKLRLLSVQEDTLQERVMDENGKLLGEPQKFGPIASGIHPTSLYIHREPGSPLLLAGLGPSQEDDNDTRLHWRWLKPDATWSKLDPFPDGKGWRHRFDLRALYGDLAVTFSNDSKTYFTWIKTGKTITLETPRLEDENPETWRVPGALLAPPQVPTAGVLPETPGAPIEDPTLAPALPECTHALPTRPDTIVLLCAQAVSDKKPGIRTGLRVYRRPNP